MVNRTRTSLAALGAVAVLAVGLLAAGAILPAFAQAPAPEDTAPPTAEAREARHNAMRTAFAERLAAELDLPADRVQEAIETVTDELRAEHREARLAALDARLDQAVADGRLTQEQADAIRAAAESGVGPLGGRGGHGLGHGRGRGGHGGGFGPGFGGGPGGAPGDATPEASGTSA
jgi:hypothetical protein